MNITDIEVSIVREAQATTRGDARLGGVTDNRQQAALVTVRTDAGLAGYGEASANPAAIKVLTESEHILLGGWNDEIKNLLIARIRATRGHSGRSSSGLPSGCAKLGSDMMPWLASTWLSRTSPARFVAFRYGNSSAADATWSPACASRSTTARADSTTRCAVCWTL